MDQAEPFLHAHAMRRSATAWSNSVFVTRTLRTRSSGPIGAFLIIVNLLGSSHMQTAWAAQLAGDTPRFRAVDTDRDARLDERELGAAADRDFRTLDVDRDGYLTAHELVRTRGKTLMLPFPGRLRSKAAFAAADTDRDGKIDTREYRTAVVRAYMRCDRNRDGTIEVSDLRRCAM